MKSNLLFTVAYWRGVTKDIFLACKRKMYSDTALILMYHSVGVNDAFFTVPPQEFVWQMDYLKKKHMNVISLADLSDLLKSGVSIPKKTVVLTFDDGYKDNYTEAYPVLMKRNLPATIFTVGQYCNGSLARDTKLKGMSMLNIAEVKELHMSDIIDIEPHTMTHKKLTKCDSADMEHEVSSSKEFFENLLNKECKYFAYPSGKFNDKVVDTVERYFEACLTTERNFVKSDTNMMLLPRYSIDSFVDRFRFRLKIM